MIVLIERGVKLTELVELVRKEFMRTGIWVVVAMAGAAVLALVWK